MDQDNNTELGQSLTHIVKKTLQLKEAISCLQSTNNSLNFYASKLLVKLHAFAEEFSHLENPVEKCQICYAEPRSHAVLPCAHVMCKACARRSHNREQKCFVCRQETTDIMKIYV